MDLSVTKNYTKTKFSFKLNKKKKKLFKIKYLSKSF